jgi:hypothetical protein
MWFEDFLLFARTLDHSLLTVIGFISVLILLWFGMKTLVIDDKLIDEKISQKIYVPSEQNQF